MNKIFSTIILVALGIVTAGAQQFTKKHCPVLLGSGIRFEFKEGLSDRHLSPANTATPGSRDDEWVAVGTGIIDENMFIGATIDVTVEESTSTPGLYRIPDAWAAVSDDPQPLIIDATDPDLVFIPQQHTGIYVEGYGSHADIMSATQICLNGGLDKEQILANYSSYVIKLVDGEIIIPDNGIFVNFPESEKTDFGRPIKDEWYGWSGAMSVYLPTHTLPWGEKAVGEMLDGFFEAKFDGFEIQPVPVTVQKHNFKEGLYRVHNPWAALIGEGSLPLIIDASDPDFVKIPRQATGVYDSQKGPVFLLSCSMKYSSLEFMESAGKGYMNITKTDNTINFPLQIKRSNDGSVSFYTGLYIQYPLDGMGLDNPVLTNQMVKGYIRLPEFSGIGNVTVDSNTNAPLEIYNICGQRVANPTPGQIYIVKQGDTVKKIVKK